jgi:hypothetical protein
MDYTSDNNKVAGCVAENIEDINLNRSTTYTLHPKKVGDVVNGFEENFETGKVTAFGGMLDIRPEYQREFVYGPQAQQAVIETVLNGAPLSNLYWVKNADGSFECLDGQQRSLSLCYFIKGKYSIKWNGCDTRFKNLPPDLKKRILNYELQVYEVEGNKSDIIAWFKIINQPCSPLKNQEIRNSVFTGTWLTAAKREFSRKNEGCHNRFKHLLSGDPTRQEILETALEWISFSQYGDKNVDKNICRYMGEHQEDENANELKEYFEKVCKWAEEVAGDCNFNGDLIKLGSRWGELYHKYHDTFVIDREKIDAEIKSLRLDDEVNTKPKGFIPYIITGNPNELFQRQFSTAMKKKAYILQKGICKHCGGYFELNQMEADHIIPWADGGKTTEDNLQMLCTDCNRRKSSGIR